MIRILNVTSENGCFGNEMVQRGYHHRVFRYQLIAVMSVILLSFQDLNSQNLYDHGNSLKYGRYLFETKQYNLAAEEFERVCFMDPGNDSVKSQLIHSYLLGKQYTLVTKRTDSLFKNREHIPQIIALNYARALIMAELNFKAEQFISSNPNLKENDRLYLSLNNQLLGNKWDDAGKTFRDIQQRSLAIDKSYHELFQQIGSVRYKSSGLALGFSAIVPGLGKVYTGNWKDGLVSFIFVAGSAIQAYRGYHEYGKKSAFFIVYTGLATTFYLGNLYGSFKSAKKHNDKIRKQLHAKMETVFSDTF